MYKYAAIALGLIAMISGLMWFFDPMVVLALSGVKLSSESLMVERRLGVVMISIGVTLLASYNAEPSPARSALCFSVMAAMLMLLLLNAYELSTGVVSSGTVAGMGFSLLFLSIFAIIEWRAHRTKKADIGN